jgi:hypothetical protein
MNKALCASGASIGVQLHVIHGVVFVSELSVNIFFFRRQHAHE